MEKCKCRFQLCDMGYFECELEVGHDGNHQYTHKPTKQNSWPDREYTIIWEQITDKDFVVTEEWLENDTNLNAVLNGIIVNTPVLTKYEWAFQDDPLYGSTPSVWLNVGYAGDYPTDENGYGEVFKEETKLHEAIEKSVVTKSGKKVLDYDLHFHIQILPWNEMEYTP
jgi:hypothetical protein